MPALTAEAEAGQEQGRDTNFRSVAALERSLTCLCLSWRAVVAPYLQQPEAGAFVSVSGY
jgi:hypothetical protein